MKTHLFFKYLQEELRKLSISGVTIFGDSVYRVPSFPIQQLPSKISPTCYILDMGSLPHKFHPNVQYQVFSVGIWLENLISRHGDQSVEEIQKVDSTVYGFIISLKRLNNEKISIRDTKKGLIVPTKSNYPCLFRAWIFDTLTEV